MDDPSLSENDLRATMADQSWIHRRLGGHGAVRRSIQRFLRLRRGRFRVLELACGSADLLQMAGKKARRLETRPALIGLDRSDRVLAVAREQQPAASFVTGEVTELPFDDESVELVLLPHALHHLDRNDAVTALREAARITSDRLLVLDLQPSPVALFLFRLLGAVFRLHWASVHDGAVSLRRAWSVSQLHELATEAGLENVRIRRHLFWRVTLEWLRPSMSPFKT